MTIKVKVMTSKIDFYFFRNMKSTITIKSEITSKNKLCCRHN